MSGTAERSQKLAGKVAVVRAARGGIGGGIAAAFAAEGADIVIADVLGPRGREARSPTRSRGRGRRSLYVHTDVTDETQVRALVTAAEAEFGRIDILVNNAGIAGQGYYEQLDVAEIDRVLQVNLRGPLLCARFVIPGMLERGGGRIISIASQLGQIGGTEMVHYSASKAGVIGMTKALAREFSTRNILVNAIAPGPINTDMLTEETEEWISNKLAELPIGRFGDVHEVAPTAVFLASDDSSYYVGQTLCPNGGDVML